MTDTVYAAHLLVLDDSVIFPVMIIVFNEQASVGTSSVFLCKQQPPSPAASVKNYE